MNVEKVSSFDEKILNDVLSDERYEWIKSYDIHIAMFHKYGKYDKDGNLKTPALVKNGKQIPLSLKVVSSFNRLTDDVDVKIVINKELWDSYSETEKKSTLDNALNYLELKTDKIGEPIPIADDNDKVQLKLKHPDFYCEGFINMIEKYGNSYIPIQDAKSIINLVPNINDNTIKNVEVKETETKKNVGKKSSKVKVSIEKDENIEDANISDDVNLDDIQL